jgi:hypothetical protein
MTTCLLNGRLGNQMFQIANMVAYSLRYNQEWLLMKQTLGNHFPMYFDYLKTGNPKYNDFIYKETPFKYTPIPEFKNGVCFFGYFQSEKYFLDYKQEVINAFQFQYPEKQKGIVSIHVRRGDYLNTSGFITISDTYIKNCIQFFNNIGYYKFLVFSDDLNYCKLTINSNIYKDCDFRYSDGQTEIQDLLLMSCCDHNIISPSSYSWWGAYLNGNTDKIILYPENWYSKKEMDTKDLIPENKSWLKIELY